MEQDYKAIANTNITLKLNKQTNKNHKEMHDLLLFKKLILIAMSKVLIFSFILPKKCSLSVVGLDLFKRFKKARVDRIITGCVVTLFSNQVSLINQLSH